jgi:hypothetical protein
MSELAESLPTPCSRGCLHVSRRLSTGRGGGIVSLSGFLPPGPPPFVAWTPARLHGGGPGGIEPEEFDKKGRTVAGAFQSDSYWFLLDNGTVAEADWDDGPDADDDFGRRLADSGRLPELGRAPVASWVVARLAHLMRGLPAWVCDQHEDEGAYRLSLLVFDRAQSHLGRAEVLADRSRVSVCCECPNAAKVLKEFSAALLSAPAKVAECRVEVREPEDEAECQLEGRGPDTRCQAVYGYERGAYIGSR